MQAGHATPATGLNAAKAEAATPMGTAVYPNVPVIKEIKIGKDAQGNPTDPASVDIWSTNGD